ncbi:MAG: isoprenylcysteine carboxylmethyltransferase family protein [Anaerolineales bacterium]|nr:isoprenylcysteine carboxylmethyltransferase family protein [Anaerolineales bacterium]
MAWGTEGIAPLGPLAWIGVPLMILGLGITIYAMDLFQVFWRWVGSQTPGLQTGGLYRFSRNPQFVAYGVLMLGFILAWWNSLVWIAFPAYAILVYAVLHVEEEHLARVYGEAYREYCTRVRRFL